MPYQWNFDVVWENWPFLAEGVAMTVLVSDLAMVGALVFGLMLALAGLSRIRALEIVVYCYTEFFRTTPFLVQLMWIYFALPRLGGPTLDPFTAGLIGLILNLRVCPETRHADNMWYAAG